MARINFEDSVFKDARYVDLCIAAGSRINGTGALTCLWIEAQKHFLKFGYIPDKNWIESGLPEYLITTGWAERVPNGVRAKGQEEQFAWLRQKSEAGKSKSENKTKNLKQNTERVFDETPNGNRTEVNAAEPPFSLLLSPSSNSLLSSQTQSQKLLKNKNIKNPTADKSGGSKIFDAYRLAYLERWKVEPIRNAKINALCKQLHDRLGADACDVVKFYLTHNDAWFLKNQHDLGSLVAKAESLHTQWQRGKPVTTQQVRQFEKQTANSDLLDQVQRGEV